MALTCSYVRSAYSVRFLEHDVSVSVMFKYPAAIEWQGIYFFLLARVNNRYPRVPLKKRGKQGSFFYSALIHRVYNKL